MSKVYAFSTYISKKLILFPSLDLAVRSKYAVKGPLYNLVSFLALPLPERLSPFEPSNLTPERSN
jgi:hypothetical protein